MNSYDAMGVLLHCCCVLSWGLDKSSHQGGFFDVTSENNRATERYSNSRARMSKADTSASLSPA